MSLWQQIQKTFRCHGWFSCTKKLQQISSLRLYASLLTAQSFPPKNTSTKGLFTSFLKAFEAALLVVILHWVTASQTADMVIYGASAEWPPHIISRYIYCIDSISIMWMYDISSKAEGFDTISQTEPSKNSEAFLFSGLSKVGSTQLRRYSRHFLQSLSRHSGSAPAVFLPAWQAFHFRSLPPCFSFGGNHLIAYALYAGQIVIARLLFD